METSLHRQLKEAFAGPNAEQEFRLGRYRIDVKDGKRLIEIQTSGLSAIRDKISKLLEDGHPVQVVKPLVQRKRLIKLECADGPVVSQRWSPKRETWLDVFNHLVYFTRVFPHPNLKLTIPLIEIEETRCPGHGRRRRWRRDDYQRCDQQLLTIAETKNFTKPNDLNRLLGRGLVAPFDTGELAAHLDVSRTVAQQIAYCLRKTGAAEQVGKRGNGWLYRLNRKNPFAPKKAGNSKASKKRRTKKKAA